MNVKPIKDVTTKLINHSNLFGNVNKIYVNQLWVIQYLLARTF